MSDAVPKRPAPGHASVVLDYRALAGELERHRRAGRTVALTNGCFDLLHVGHLRLLRDGARYGDVLVVALNADASIREQKGPERPWVPLEERAELLAGIAGVDYVTSFPERTADALLAALRPDVHIKGTDWTVETVPEGAVVLAYGGRIAICGDPKTHSSTAIAQRARMRSG
jgi:rfaE bifunctional protein nucleotidyltransferase chain/domain